MSPTLVLLIVIAYFGVLYVTACVAGRKSDNQGFFVGNRQSSWFVVGFAMIGSSISGVTFVSVPGMVLTSQFSYLQMVLGFMVGQLLVAYLLVPLFYRMQVVSIYSYLNSRFGSVSHKTGAWFFFVSKMLGASVRLFLVCFTLQFLVFDVWGIPFVLNVCFTVGLVWLYTFRSGVKSLIWTDSLKTICLVSSVGLCIYFIASDLGLNINQTLRAIADSELSQLFFFDDAKDKRYFFKQFLAGVFTMIAMTGLDQDMMQRNLSCKNPQDAQKNMLLSGVMQFFINALFLMLGVLLYLFTSSRGIENPAKTDELFPLIATGGYLPLLVGILFLIGFISSAYAAAGSALTALTSSFTIDIWGIKGKNEAAVKQVRKRIHLGMALLMGLVIVLINLLNNTSVIDAVYTLASYTYGPILGLFSFGLFTKRRVYDRWVPVVAIVSPLVCYVLQANSAQWLNGYKFSYELLLFNALFTAVGCWLLSAPAVSTNTTS